MHSDSHPFWILILIILGAAAVLVWLISFAIRSALRHRGLLIPGA